jgi:hypothetical protein
MKKWMLGFTLLLSAVSVFAVPPDQKFTLGLTAGWGLYCGGDYNAAMNGYNDFIDEFYPGGAGRYKKFNTGFNAGLEGIYWFKPNMGLGLGVNWYQSAFSDNPVDFEAGANSFRYDISSSVNVVPVTLNFHYQMPLCELSFLEFFFGPGLYFGCFDFLKDYEYDYYDEQGTYEFNGKSTALGLQGGAAVTFPIVKDKLWFFGGIEGRTTSLKNFKDAWSDAGRILGNNYSESGTGHQFWTFDAENGSKSFPIFYFGEDKPAGLGVKNARAGSVGGGGLQLKIGLRAGL